MIWKLQPLKKKRSVWTRFLTPTRLSSIIAGFWAFSGAIATGLDPWQVQWLERHTQTLFFGLRGPVTPPEEIIILAIDDRSLATAEKYLQTPEDEAELSDIELANLKAIESWPWRRAIYGVAVERLMAAGARVVALDILFDLPSSYGEADDRKLQQVLQTHAQNVVWASVYLSNSGPEGELLERFDPIAELETQPMRVGLVNFPALEADTRVHRLGRAYAEEVLRPLNLEILPSFAEVALETAGLDYPPPKGEDIFFYGPKGTFKTIPFWQILLSDWWETYLEDKTFKDKIVLIGPTSPTAFSDEHPTPVDPVMPGVEIHANAIASLLRGKTISPLIPHPLGRGFFVLGLVGIGGFLLRQLVQKPFKQMLWGLSLGTIWLGITYGTFTLVQVTLPGMIPAIALALTGFCDFAIGAVKDRLEKRRLRKTLGRYVAEPVVQEILRQPDDFYTMLQGHRLNVAVLFSDIRGFTALCYKLPPENLMVQLNDYFHAMVEAIVGAGGTLDKFIGDAVMAEFGFPISQGAKQDALNAVRAALAMRRDLAKLRQSWRKKGRIPFFNGIGISYGEVVAGDIGSWRRREYAVLGDTVNVASRVEGLTKDFSTDILITQSLYELVKDEVEAIDLGEHPLKGRENSQVRLYSLVGLKGEDGKLYHQVMTEFQNYSRDR